jgi:general secretion pathway protein A
MLSFSFQASPFAHTEPTIVDFPVTQRTQIDHLLNALLNQQGLHALIVENGSPTAEFVPYLMAGLPYSVRAAQLDTQGLSEIDFLHTLCQGLAIPLGADEPASEVPGLVNRILHALNALEQGGMSQLLIVRQAHLASDAVMHHIMALSSPSNEKPGRLCALLVGGPDLQKALARIQNKAPLNAHVSVFNLPGLTELDTIDHIRGRMECAGWKGTLPFELAALKRIHAASAGLPAKINSICELAWRSAQDREQPTITDALVAQVLGQTVPRSSEIPAVEPPAFEHPVVVKPATETKPRAWFHRNGVTAGGVALAAVLLGTAWWLQPEAPATLRLSATDSADAVNMAGDAVSASGHTTPSEPPTQVALARPVAAPAPSATGTTKAPATAPLAKPVDLVQLAGMPLPPLATLSNDADRAWASTATLWRLKVTGPNACRDVLEQGHQCFRFFDGNLPALRKLDRPGLAQLQQDGITRWVSLMNWTGDTMTLALGEQRWQVSSVQFAQLWTGSYTTFWRQPMDTTTRIFAAKPEGPAGRWLDRQLEKLQTMGSLPISAKNAQQRIVAFQKQQELPGAGKALPSTFIRVNQLTGAKEPRLLIAKAQ